MDPVVGHIATRYEANVQSKIFRYSTLRIHAGGPETRKTTNLNMELDAVEKTIRQDDNNPSATIIAHKKSEILSS